MENSVATAPDDREAGWSPPAATDAYRLRSMLELIVARDLRDDLRARLEAGTLVLDAAGVDRLSTPCAQVLLAAGQAASCANVPFRIVNPSEAFSSALTELGLESQFSKWMV